MMSGIGSICSKVGQRMKAIQMPSIPRPSFPSNIWGRLSNASTATVEAVPYATSFADNQEALNEVCAIC